LSLAFVFSIPSLAQIRNPSLYTPVEKEIINDSLKQFRKECPHISILDENKLEEIQKFYTAKKDSLTKEQQECLETHLTQLVAAHSIYRQSCDEMTSKKKFKEREDLPRLFLNSRKFASGIRPQQEKLNECLIRNGADRTILLPYSDYELNNRILSKKIRDLNLEQPFSENSVDYR